MYRATAALNEVLESITARKLAQGPIQALTFDELNLDIELRYQGTLLDASPRQPTESEFLEEETAPAGLAGLLIRQYADRIKTELQDGVCHVALHFDH